VDSDLITSSCPFIFMPHQHDVSYSRLVILI